MSRVNVDLVKYYDAMCGLHIGMSRVFNQMAESAECFSMNVPQLGYAALFEALLILDDVLDTTEDMGITGQFFKGLGYS